MRSSRLWTVSFLALTLAVAAVPSFAATPTPPPNADPTAAALLDSIFAPATGVPTPELQAIQPPYNGYCSQTCRRCYSGNPQPCPPDPDTGFNQTCTRIPLC
ncbi:MAG TPA: hypothetical protein VF173_18540 [Thermoanaerobaculia bacterium]|nr:hypothetical protein [Thermoanaerobaculia bacterium]